MDDLSTLESELDRLKALFNVRGQDEQILSSARERITSMITIVSGLSATSAGTDSDSSRTRAAALIENLERLQFAQSRGIPSQEIARLMSQEKLREAAPPFKVPEEEEQSVASTLLQRTLSEDAVEFPDSRDGMSKLAGHSSEQESVTIAVYSWGRADLGALLRTETSASFDPSQAISFSEVRRIRQISSNSYHSAAVTTTGELYLCGSNDEGQVSDERTDPGQIIMKPRLMESLLTHRIAQVSCGVYHTACITATGLCLTFGGNDAGELGHSIGTLSRVQPRPVDGLARKIASYVSCGERFTVILITTGDVFSCGLGACSGHTKAESSHRAERIEALIGYHIISLATGNYHAFALANDGSLFGWGSGTHGMLGLADMPEHVQCPTLIPVTQEFGKPMGISAGESHSVLWTDTGKVLGTGMNKYGQIASQLPRVVEFSLIPIDKVTSVACGSTHTVVLVNEGTMSTVYAFGMNNFGQIEADSPQALYRSPVQMSKLSSKNILTVSAGGNHSFAIGAFLRDEIDRSSDLRSLLSRKFSLEANKGLAQIPFDANGVIAYIEGSLKGSETVPENIRINEIIGFFSFASILSGSFHTLSKTFCIDIAGLDECYSQIMRRLDNQQKLLNAFTLALEDVCIMMLTPSSIDSALRIANILLLSPILSNPKMSGCVLKLLCRVLGSKNCSKDQRQNLIKFYQSIPTHLYQSRLLEPLQNYISFLISSSEFTVVGIQGKEEIVQALIVIGLLYVANEKVNLVPVESFYNVALNKLQLQYLFRDYVSFLSDISSSASPTNIFFSSFSFLFSCETKRDLLLADSQMKQHTAQQQFVVQTLMSGQAFAPYFVMSIDRNQILTQTMSHIERVPDAMLKMPLKIIFNNEEGIDEGGVKKEFFQILTAQLFDMQFGMFQTCGEAARYLWLNRDCTWSFDEYRMIGVLVGLAVYNGVILNVSFPKVLYKKLLGQPVTFDDIQDIDPELHSGLKQLLEYSPAEDVEDVFCRTHEIIWNDSLGEQRRVELVLLGADVPVTGQNREAFVQAYTKWLLVDSIATQFDQFKIGFNRVVSPASTVLFHASELELIVAGHPILDFNELQQSAKYVGWIESNPAENATIKAFWEVAHGFNLEQKQKLLKFVTGSAQIPIGGLRRLEFVIQRMGPKSNSLPTSHTCFNTFLLPDYGNKDLLSDRLLLALKECEGFGLK